ncbi:hypothetical protein [Thermococcus paralvinellae]|uniref:hypothetical protein n=1 Tax=Thermococcus paralvinellae TaxID=582419 RepID=UPI0005B27795|nr:hypothetical protein [Thermococcus paralvinellae]
MIICKEKTIEGKELEEYQKWIEIDCTIIIAYKMRGYLFWHPHFRRWYQWCEAMRAHARQYFDFTPISRQFRGSLKDTNELHNVD